MTDGVRFPVLIGAWVALSLVNGLFWWIASPAMKRSWRTRIIIASGVLFVAFTYCLAPNSLLLVGFSVPAAAIVTFMNLRCVKICPSCGASTRTAWRSPRAELTCCRKCGTSLS